MIGTPHDNEHHVITNIIMIFSAYTYKGTVLFFSNTNFIQT